MDQRQASQASLGGILIATGVVFLGQRLGWGPGWRVSQVWPALLMAGGALEIVLTGGRWRRGVFWIFLGAIFFLDRRGVLLIRDSWPLFIVLAGLSILLGSQRCGGRSREVRRGE